MNDWHVQVFRFTVSKGWELCQLPPNSEPVTAAPKKGSIEIRKLRLRIHLFQDATSPSTESGATILSPNQRCKHEQHEQLLLPKTPLVSSTSTSEKNTVRDNRENATHSLENSNDTHQRAHSEKPLTTEKPTTSPTNNPASAVICNTTVIQRQDTILLSGSKGLGAIVLKFQDVDKCKSFSDRLVELNSDDMNVMENMTATDRSSHFNSYGEKRRKLSDISVNRGSCADKMDRVFKEFITKDTIRKDSTSFADSRSKHTTKNDHQEEACSDIFVLQKRSEYLSYMVRLLHDPDFKQFVQKIEKNLLSSPDCKYIMEALEGSFIQKNI